MNATAPSLEGDDRASILIVDDRPENLLALEQILDPLGQDITKATSGADALRCLLHQDYAVILLDVQMPGMDGLETASRIKQRERCRHVPIIFLTAISVDRHDAFEGYSAGAVDYLSRPFEPWLLRSKVAVFLDVHLERQRAARLSAELSRAQLRRRHAIELNDTVVQGLAVAKYALELGRPEQARAAVEDTLEAAKRVIGDLLLDEQVGPGDLVRITPSRQATAHHDGR